MGTASRNNFYKEHQISAVESLLRQRTSENFMGTVPTSLHQSMEWLRSFKEGVLGKQVTNKMF